MKLESSSSLMTMSSFIVIQIARIANQRMILPFQAYSEHNSCFELIWLNVYEKEKEVWVLLLAVLNVLGFIKKLL